MSWIQLTTHYAESQIIISRRAQRNSESQFIQGFFTKISITKLMNVMNLINN
jgi:hypothetical protein